MKRIWITKQPAPWLRDLNIVSLKSTSDIFDINVIKLTKMTTDKASERLEMNWNQKSNLLKNHFTANHYHLNTLKKSG